MCSWRWAELVPKVRACPLAQGSFWQPYLLTTKLLDSRPPAFRGCLSVHVSPVLQPCARQSCLRVSVSSPGQCFHLPTSWEAAHCDSGHNPGQADSRCKCRLSLLTEQSQSCGGDRVAREEVPGSHSDREWWREERREAPGSRRE